MAARSETNEDYNVYYFGYALATDVKSEMLWPYDILKVD
jgi:hypothetical protein